ncbi:MAG TPA: phenylalanine--tRNA ligase subunit beta [Bacillota bacterium]
MRVPLSWLQEWVDVPWDVDELAERLTAVGLAIEAIERPGAEVSGVIVARIDEVKPHPAADRLWVVTIDTGRGTATVVTGAGNARPGAFAIYAAPGARLAGGLEIRERSFRGVLSQGMLCSTWELGLPTAAKTEEDRLAEGLLLLEGGSSVRPGADAGPLLGLGEPVLVLDLTPNYAAHCQSILGVAREVAALTGAGLHPPAAPVVEPAETAADAFTRVEIRAEDGCGCYIARVLDGVSVGRSPLWLQRRLQLAGMRPINNVVDVTNYVMLETGQPLHAFDYDRLQEGRIVVRRARAGERLLTLDGEERRLEPGDLVIADAERPVALAGIMGGAETEVSQQTRRVLLEAAHFEPLGILRTSRRMGLRTEASGRFEKGLDPEGVEPASARAAAWIAALAGAKLLAGRVAAVARNEAPRRIPWRPQRINGLLGTDLSETELRDLLGRYGFIVENDGVRVPSYRTDVFGEADLAEEVARLYGYDRIPSRLPSGAPATAGRSRWQVELLTVRRHLVGCGFSEVTTFSFAPADLGDRLHLPDDHPWRQALRLANPMNEDQAALRTTLLGSMLEVVRYNRRRRNDALALFEIGTTYLPDGEGLPREPKRLMLAAAGDLRPRHWQGHAEPADVYLLKGVLERLAQRLGRELAFRPEPQPFLHPGRAAAVYAAGGAVGYLGELHPDLIETWELPPRLVVAEVDLSAWLAAEAQVTRFQPLPRFPAVERDVAFVLPLTVPAARAEAVIREHAGPWLEQLTLFDVYQGEPVPAGCRSLAYALRYRAADRTLTDAEVDEVHERVRQALAAELGATLR